MPLNKPSPQIEQAHTLQAKLIKQIVSLRVALHKSDRNHLEHEAAYVMAQKEIADLRLHLEACAAQKKNLERIQASQQEQIDEQRRVFDVTRESHPWNVKASFHRGLNFVRWLRDRPSQSWRQRGAQLRASLSDNQMSQAIQFDQSLSTAQDDVFVGEASMGHRPESESGPAQQSDLAKVEVRRWIIDVTVLAHTDAGTGIQRVTRNVALELLRAPPAGYKVELARTTNDGFITARHYASVLLETDGAVAEEEALILSSGDVFLALDLNFALPMLRPWVELGRRNGAKMFVVVYDLLPINMPEAFDMHLPALYRRWLDTVIELADGILCISRSVADELRQWIDSNEHVRQDLIRIGWFHQGTALPSCSSAKDTSAEELIVLDAMRKHASVLSVGTIEPRKSYAEVLNAFDVLWDGDADVCLTIVGKWGWLVDDVVNRIVCHPQLGQKLFWLFGISDEVLAEVYRSSDLLLAASRGEGFGLPLIEAQQFGVPVLARDIPVFREVARPAARFFSTNDATALADEIELSLQQPPEDLGDERPYSWRDSTNRLTQHLQGKWYLVGKKAGSRFHWTAAQLYP